MTPLRCLLALLLAVPAAHGLPPGIAQIVKFAHSKGPYHDVTITAAEADEYWAGAGAARLPKGIAQVRMGSRPGELNGSAKVNFDTLAAGRISSPLLALFRGEHTVAVTARVDAAQAPRAQLTVIGVWLDGEQIPNFLLDAAVAAFVHPKYPDIGRTFTVPLPGRATSVSVGGNAITVHYPQGTGTWTAPKPRR